MLSSYRNRAVGVDKAKTLIKLLKEHEELLSPVVPAKGMGDVLFS